MWGEAAAYQKGLNGALPLPQALGGREDATVVSCMVWKPSLFLCSQHPSREVTLCSHQSQSSTCQHPLCAHSHAWQRRPPGPLST